MYIQLSAHADVERLIVQRALPQPTERAMVRLLLMPLELHLTKKSMNTWPEMQIPPGDMICTVWFLIKAITMRGKVLVMRLC